ncbi:MAG: hypothetical protein J1F07_02070 [Muribaculaceae bacterium]|nr:hypothetical protein [Muribaculaceae bacterium]
MKKKNSRCDYTDERNEALCRAFRNKLAQQHHATEIFAEVANSPARRFYINEDRAYALLKRKRETGEWAPGMSPTRRRMLNAIEERVVRLETAEPGISLIDAVYRVVNSPAPGFFLTPGSVKTTIYTYINKRRG